jgi:hypothetical protein
MKVGDLVRFTADVAHAFYGIVLELGNQYWDGAQWSVAHTRVQWPDAKVTWEVTDRLEILSTT